MIRSRAVAAPGSASARSRPARRRAGATASCGSCPSSVSLCRTSVSSGGSSAGPSRSRGRGRQVGHRARRRSRAGRSTAGRAGRRGTPAARARRTAARRSAGSRSARWRGGLPRRGASKTSGSVVMAAPLSPIAAAAVAGGHDQIAPVPEGRCALGVGLFGRYPPASADASAWTSGAVAVAERAPRRDRSAGLDPDASGPTARRPRAGCAETPSTTTTAPGGTSATAARLVAVPGPDAGSARRGRRAAARTHLAARSGPSPIRSMPGPAEVVDVHDRPTPRRPRRAIRRGERRSCRRRRDPSMPTKGRRPAACAATQRGDARGDRAHRAPAQTGANADSSR